MMNRKLALALSLGLLASLVAVDAAQAKWRVSVFAGNRAQVVYACEGASMELSQHMLDGGVGATLCFNWDNGASVLCTDAGQCKGTWNDGTPDVISGGRGGGGNAPRGKPLIAGVPAGGSSLSEPGTSYPLDPPEPGPNDGGPIN